MLHASRFFLLFSPRFILNLEETTFFVPNFFSKLHGSCFFSFLKPTNSFTKILCLNTFVSLTILRFLIFHIFILSFFYHKILRFTFFFDSFVFLFVLSTSCAPRSPRLWSPGRCRRCRWRCTSHSAPNPTFSSFWWRKRWSEVVLFNNCLFSKMCSFFSLTFFPSFSLIFQLRFILRNGVLITELLFPRSLQKSLHLPIITSQKTLPMELPVAKIPASQRTLCRRIHAFSHFLQVHEVHEVQSIENHPDTNTN